MKDSWGPLKALAAASVINGVGDIVLCTYLGYGIAGAAWATMASQVCGTNSSASIFNCIYICGSSHLQTTQVVLSTALLLLGCCCLYDDANSKHEGIQCLCLIYPFREGIYNDTWACCSCVYDNDVKGCAKYFTKFIALYGISYSLLM